MKFEQFIAACQVWFLEDFWHVRVNTKRDITSDQELGQHARLLSMGNPRRPIQFSSLAGSIVWMHNGLVTCPFEPAMYTSVGPTMSMDWKGFDPAKRLDSWAINTQTGTYRAHWDSSRLDRDHHTVLHAGGANSAYLVWGDIGAANSVTHSPQTDLYTRPGWDTISSSFANSDSVRYAETRRVGWEHITEQNGVLSTNNRLFRKDATKPTAIIDTDVYERGAVIQGGKLAVTRLVKSREYRWARNRQTMGTNPIFSGTPQDTNYHRDDGPALVTLHLIKETIMDDRINLIYPGGYTVQWYRGGVKVPMADVNKWARSTGAILVDAPCHDRPAFVSEMDQVSWLAGSL